LFVERDQTERDYGIDLSIECFDDGEPSGSYLLIQLKGTDDPDPTDASLTIPFDFEVKSLLRVNRFATPVLLIWCPVQAEPHKVWFLWLQSYIRVVLDNEKPNWREQQTVRLHIPVENVIPDEEGQSYRRLRHIANHPSRVEQFGQLARLTHEAPFKWDDPAKLAPLFQECLQLDAIFGDPNWRWATFQRGVVEKGLQACEIALDGFDPTDEQLKQIGWVLSERGAPKVEGAPPHPEDLDWEMRWEYLGFAARHCAQLLLNMVAVYFDDRLRYTVWQANGEHDF